MSTKADVELDLSTIHVELDTTLNGDFGIGLDDIKADLNADLGLDDVKLTADLGLDEIKADLKADLGLDKINAKADLKADLGLDKINAKADLKADLGLDKINARGQLDASAHMIAAVRELAPIFLNLLWKEIPLVRVGTPHRYKLGLRIFGLEVAALTLCGESELITEDLRHAPGGHHGDS
jgi:hypothetical protein